MLNFKFIYFLLGNLKNGVNDIKTHKWFQSIDWMSIYFKKIKPPTIPKLKSPHDTSYFENIKEEDIPSSRDNLYENEFRNF